MRLIPWILAGAFSFAAAVGAWLAVGQIANLKAQVVQLQKQSTTPLPTEAAPPFEATELNTLAEVEERVHKLGERATARQIAEQLAELDSWTFKPEDGSKFIAAKFALAARLRREVKKEVEAQQQATLTASSGAEAAKKHGEAGQILSVYPMSQDQAVLEEAKKLSGQQAEVANRIEVIRRQRYNHWAAEQIGAAIRGYNEKKATLYNTWTDRHNLMDSLAANLGEIDPSLIEPAVMEIYNYVLELTKGHLGEDEKTDLAKRLTDPSIRRKTFGDF